MNTDFETELIKVTDLEIDPQVQRDHLSMAKIERMKRAFNPNALGVVVVSRRKNGQQVVLDGMHRVQVVKEVTDATGTVLCHVFTGLSIADEAELFLLLNAGTQPHAIDKFNVSVVKGDPAAVEINKIVRSHGWEVGSAPRKGIINAVKALARVYLLSIENQAEPNLLDLALRTITRAWQLDRHGVQAPMIEALGRFFGEYGSQVDLDRLMDQLANYPGGPQALLTESRQMANMRRRRVAMAVADQLVYTYNKGLSSSSRNRLPAWRFQA